MKRLYEAAAYAPQSGAYWQDTCQTPDWHALAEDTTCDTAIIGGGFTGLNAALTLAQAGQNVVVLEAEHPAWGASGRNGGFCCVGGALLETPQLKKLYGSEDAALWQQTQTDAIDHVDGLLREHSIDADTHSHGETVLAHSARAWRALQKEAETAQDTDGTRPVLLEKSALTEGGFGGPWFGGMTLPIGFALNPAKYHAGLCRAALGAGARLYGHSPVTALRRDSQWHLTTGAHRVTARQVILATNGYSSEDLPPWLRARTLPVQSSVIVTRPLTSAEQQAANWTTTQMAYDSRRLLHYFRMLPEGRFLFGMRGGLTARPSARRAISRRIRKDFHAAFPAWRDVEITHEWSGLVCLMARGHPFVGPVPEHPGLFAAMGFHGNGVAMGSFAGSRIAAHVLNGCAPDGLPAFLAMPPGRFPFGQYRRALLRPAYFLAETLDL